MQTVTVRQRYKDKGKSRPHRARCRETDVVTTVTRDNAAFNYPQLHFQFASLSLKLSDCTAAAKVCIILLLIL